MQDFSTSPREMVASFWRNRSLINASVRREVLGRYRGSYFGIMWSFFNPVLMLVIYTFVFSVIFKSHWVSNSDSKTEFALVLFIGLILFNLFSECVNRAPALITLNVNYVKKVVFPLEILPYISLIAALFHCLIGFGVWFLAYIIFFGLPHATTFYFPLVISPFLVFILGLSWALASLGVFLRDVTQFIGVVTSMLMFLSPVFYPASSLPEAYRDWLYLNPLAIAMEQMRGVLFWGNSPDFLMLGIFHFTSLVVAWLGFVWFQKTRKGFADVL
jgi:lipopolysaccharide transport system permease protein